MQPMVTIAIIAMNSPATHPNAIFISWQEGLIAGGSAVLVTITVAYTVEVSNTVIISLFSEVRCSNDLVVGLIGEQGMLEYGVGDSVTVDGVHTVFSIFELLF